jgi:hypothetical protein
VCRVFIYKESDGKSKKMQAVFEDVNYRNVVSFFFDIFLLLFFLVYLALFLFSFIIVLLLLFILSFFSFNCYSSFLYDSDDGVLVLNELCFWTLSIVWCLKKLRN